MLERALKGDVKAGDLVFRWLANVIDLGHETDESKPLSHEDQAVLDRYIDTKIESRGDPESRESRKIGECSEQ